MRYNREKELARGDTRVVRRFLFLPLTLHLKDDVDERRIYETRWLEWAEIIQVADMELYKHWTTCRWNDN